jgi:hypothetical protein
MRKYGFRMSAVSCLTVALGMVGSQAQAQSPQGDLTGTSSTTTTDPYPTSAPEAVQPAPVAPDAEVGSMTTTADRVDQDRWKFPNRPLIITGSTVLAASYAPVAIAGALSDELSKKVYYPVAGPWMEIAQESNSNTDTALLAIDGVLQGLGALALVSGFVIPERKTQSWYLIGNAPVALMPTLSPRNIGLGAFARF